MIGAETAIGFVDGARGRLLYRGYPIEELVTNGTYASVLDLLLTGEWHPDAELTPAANAFLKHMQAFVKSKGSLPDEAAEVAAH